MTEAATLRADAARLLRRVVARERTLDQVLEGREVAPLTRELLFGSVRHFYSLQAVVDARLSRPLKPKDQDIWCLMIVGVYQLRFTRIPDHAALFETVNACGPLRKPWAKGLVNAVLQHCRDAQSERSFEHPEWLELALRHQYPDAEAIMSASNARAPLTLRINRARIGVEDYHGTLAAAAISGRPPRMERQGLAPGAQAWVLDTPQPVATLPGYPEGLVSVQDPAAQFAAGLLSVRPGDTVLDACAAPGGKLFHLIERHPAARVTALEVAPARLAHIQAEAERLGHRDFTAIAGNAAETGWWDGTPFRHVLLDAPCSGTGTLRRHPDIKLLRGTGEIRQHAMTQRRLLANLWRVVEPGGNLLYCTCSILAAENDEVIGGFLAEAPDAVAVPLGLASGRPARHGWQLLPTNPDTDGFYYALMSKAGA